MDHNLCTLREAAVHFHFSVYIFVRVEMFVPLIIGSIINPTTSFLEGDREC